MLRRIPLDKSGPDSGRDIADPRRALPLLSRRDAQPIHRTVNG
jgi:hypothetical protein